MHPGIGVGERGHRLLERLAERSDLAARHEHLPAMRHQDGGILTVPAQLQDLRGQPCPFLHPP